MLRSVAISNVSDKIGAHGPSIKGQGFFLIEKGTHCPEFLVDFQIKAEHVFSLLNHMVQRAAAMPSFALLARYVIEEQ